MSNKLRYRKGLGDNANGWSWPTSSGELGRMVKCVVHSPIAADHKRVIIHPKDIAVKPVMPEDGDDFLQELVRTARFVQLAKSGARIGDESTQAWSNFFGGYSKDGELIPEVFKEKYKVETVLQLAELVHSDTPTQLNTDLIDWLRKDGAKVNTDLFPKTNYVRFNDGGVVTLYNLPGYLVSNTSPTAFAVKWYYGMARPEEVIGAWCRGEYVVENAVINDMLEDAVDKAAVAKDERSFTTYPEGCPPHPSFIAMHSSLASASCVLPVVMKLTESQRYQCILFQAAVAMGRTASGVHYPQDNKAGLMLGQECAEILLKAELVKYGADAETVGALCDQYKVKWDF